MSLRIFSPDPDDAPLPHRVWLELECDGAHASIERTLHVFADAAGYPHQRASATRAGWKFPSDGRVLGPCCSGKVTPCVGR
jgi:hypothetical protein